MVSFTQIALFAAAAATAVTATPVQSQVEKREASSQWGLCWAKGAKATDGRTTSEPPSCRANTWNETAFDAPFVLLNGNQKVATTIDSHISFGPWHCCATCAEADGCIGWRLNLDCSCDLFKLDPAVIPQVTLGVYGGPYHNYSGTFHRNGDFPVGPTLFGNTVVPTYKK